MDQLSREFHWYLWAGSLRFWRVTNENRVGPDLFTGARHSAAAPIQSDPSCRCILLDSRGFLKFTFQWFSRPMCVLLPLSPHCSLTRLLYVILSSSWLPWAILWLTLLLNSDHWFYETVPGSSSASPNHLVVAYCAGTEAGWGLSFIFVALQSARSLFLSSKFSGLFLSVHRSHCRLFYLGNA